VAGTKQSDGQSAPAGVSESSTGSTAPTEPQEAAARRDQTRAGGRFLVGGRLVDADGAPIEE
jgi:hypothetical protein